MPLRDVIQQHRDHLLQKENVVGVGEGNGQVVVLVSKKKPMSALRTVDVVERLLPDPQPLYMDAYPTDVIEVGDIRLLNDPNNDPNNYGLRPGASIGPKNRMWAGTCGCLVEKVVDDNKRILCILTNNHVIADNNLPIGTEIVHPSHIDADESGPKVVGKLLEYVPIVFDRPNYVDAAIGEVTNPDFVIGNDEIFEISGHVAIDEQVYKTGRTSGRSEGTVLAKDATIQIDFDGNLATFAGQIVTTAMLRPGDSGSVGVTTTNKLFGLGFAGSDEASLFNPIDVVFETLNLTLPDEESITLPAKPKRVCWLIDYIRYLFGPKDEF